MLLRLIQCAIVLEACACTVTVQAWLAGLHIGPTRPLVCMPAIQFLLQNNNYIIYALATYSVCDSVGSPCLCGTSAGLPAHSLFL